MYHCLISLLHYTAKRVIDLVQNTTIEERVTMLESQVVEIEEDLTVLDEDVTTLGVGLAGLSDDVDFLFDEQVIQDERLLSLEQENGVIDDELESEFFLYYLY